MTVHSEREQLVMKIGIITAMPEEFRAVAKSLGAVTRTRLGVFRAGRFSSASHEYLLVESGMGFGNATGAAEILIRDWQPDFLISTGYCGGLEPALQSGDVVVAKIVIIAGKDGFDEIPVLISSISQTFVARQVIEGQRVVGGTFVSTPAITTKCRLTGMLSGNYPYPVVEMESGAIAIIAAESNVPFLAIRAVCDTASEELEFSLGEFCSADLRRILPYKVFLSALFKPRIIPQLVRLAISSRKAAEGITAALPRLFPLL
jgi:adenosylhomocysteine nucleosidase